MLFLKIVTSWLKRFCCLSLSQADDLYDVIDTNNKQKFRITVKTIHADGVMI